MWIPSSYREEAHFKGYTVVDPATVLTTHLTEVVKDNLPELLSYSETQKLLDDLDRAHQKLVADVIPSQITVTGLAARAAEFAGRTESRSADLPTILEGISEGASGSRNVNAITEHVRSRLARSLCDSNANAAGVLPLVTLSPEWETAFAESIVMNGEDRQLSMAPSRLQQFISAVRATYDRFSTTGESPVLLTSPAIRPYVRSIVERFRPLTS